MIERLVHSHCVWHEGLISLANTAIEVEQFERALKLQQHNSLYREPCTRNPRTEIETLSQSDLPCNNLARHSKASSTVRKEI